MKRREELDQYREFSAEELSAETARLKESLFRLKFKLALGEVDAVKRIREEKKIVGATSYDEEAKRIGSQIVWSEPRRDLKEVAD